MYRLYVFAAKVVPLLPDWLVLALAWVIGLVAWIFNGGARRNATVNMLHVLGPDIRATRAGRRRLRRTVRGIFQSSARNYLEAFAIPRKKPQDIIRALPAIEGLEHFEEARAQGKGVILVSAHVGPFEYMAQWFPAKGYDVLIPVEHLKDERILDLMLSLRRRQGVNFTPLGGTAPIRAMIAALRKNGLVLITGDRAVVGESVERKFFGAPARLPTGSFTLAQRTGAIVVSAIGWYETRTRMGGRFAPVSLALPEDQRLDPDKLQCKAIEAMEEVIRAHPEQWMVYERVWEE
jgi:lauroyl/myristoyl acyltransferase